MIRILTVIGIANLLLVSCISTGEVDDRIPPEERFIYYDIDEEVGEDEEMSAFIQPYVEEMALRMDRVITISEGTFEQGKPEGTLGNLAADIIRYRATTEMREAVHVSIMNNGGLRVPLPEGEITVGHVYELMPFENHITVLRFTGEQLKQIANELAKVNGEPVSGLRFRISGDEARGILVRSMNVDPDQHYWVATNNWMADGGGASATLWEPQERRDLDVLIRDAIIEYLRGYERIAPYSDQRIRN